MILDDELSILRAPMGWRATALSQYIYIAVLNGGAWEVNEYLLSCYTSHLVTVVDRALVALYRECH